MPTCVAREIEADEPEEPGLHGVRVLVLPLLSVSTGNCALDYGLPRVQC
jgi:hypothetical protein